MAPLPENPDKKPDSGLPDLSGGLPKRPKPTAPAEGGLPSVGSGLPQAPKRGAGLPKPPPKREEALPAMETEESDEDVFEELDLSELEEADQEDAQQEQEATTPSKKKSTQRPVAPPKEEKSVQRQKPTKKEQKQSEKKEPNAFIDKKGLSILPFGRKQKNLDGTLRKQNVSEFDDRNNLRKHSKLVQNIFLGLLGFLVIIGLINALVPDDALDEDDVAEIVGQMTGNIGFPTERGEAFAENFIHAYANRDGSSINDAALAFFYTGEEGNRLGTETGTMTRNGDYSQQVIYEPRVFDHRIGSQFSASYTVGMALSVSDDPDGIPVMTPDGDPNIQWRFFSVNVFYDPNTDALSIADGSPTVVPPINIGSAEQIPNEQTIGTGTENPELNAETRGTVEGYITAFMDVTPESNSAVSQYIVSEDAPQSVVSGFGGAFEIDGDPADAIATEAFYRGEEGSNEAIVRTTVSMRDTATDYESTEDRENSYVSYESTYMVFLVREGERWVVSDIEAYVHVADPEEVIQ